ncbi:MAG: ACP S-malonyltransferase [Lachnospiraceae bacterium]
MKLAVVFPGQGSQYENMGRDFYEQYEVSKECYKLANHYCDLTMEELIFTTNSKLNQTRYTQIAMLANELAIWSVLKQEGVCPQGTAGLSLGEYAALVVSKSLSLEDAYALVTKRGRYMEEAVPVGGAMTAILGMDAQELYKLCIQEKGIVSIANYNCPEQLVITGEIKAVQAVALRVKEEFGKKSIPLNVSGPFHSILLEEAGKKLEKDLETISFSTIEVPYVSNVTGKYVQRQEEIPGLLVRQISQSVKWQQSVEQMIADGFDTFLEVGPKTTLTGFLKKMNPNIQGYHIEKVKDLDEILKKVRNGN